MWTFTVARKEKKRSCSLVYLGKLRFADDHFHFRRSFLRFRGVVRVSMETAMLAIVIFVHFRRFLICCARIVRLGEDTTAFGLFLIHKFVVHRLFGPTNTRTRFCWTMQFEDQCRRMGSSGLFRFCSGDCSSDVLLRCSERCCRCCGHWTASNISRNKRSRKTRKLLAPCPRWTTFAHRQHRLALHYRSASKTKVIWLVFTWLTSNSSGWNAIYLSIFSSSLYHHSFLRRSSSLRPSICAEKIRSLARHLRLQHTRERWLSPSNECMPIRLLLLESHKPSHHLHPWVYLILSSNGWALAGGRSVCLSSVWTTVGNHRSWTSFDPAKRKSCKLRRRLASMWNTSPVRPSPSLPSIWVDKAGIEPCGAITIGQRMALFLSSTVRTRLDCWWPMKNCNSYSTIRTFDLARYRFSSLPTKWIYAMLCPMSVSQQDWDWARLRTNLGISVRATHCKARALPKGSTGWAQRSKAPWIKLDDEQRMHASLPFFADVQFF